MLSALEMCHSTGIAHRDIKPENILLDNNFQLRMADFGLSSIMEVRFLHVSKILLLTLLMLLEEVMMSRPIRLKRCCSVNVLRESSRCVARFVGAPGPRTIRVCPGVIRTNPPYITWAGRKRRVLH